MSFRRLEWSTSMNTQTQDTSGRDGRLVGKKKRVVEIDSYTQHTYMNYRVIIIVVIIIIMYNGRCVSMAT